MLPPPSPTIVIAGLANSILPWVNSQKCLMKIQYREFDGPAVIAIGGGGMWRKLRAKKLNRRFQFFQHDFRHPSRVLRWLKWGWGVCGWLGDENRNRKNRTGVFDFFGVIFITHRGPVMITTGRRSVWVIGWRKLRPKKSTDVFDFFGCDFCHPVSFHRNCRTFKFAILRFRPTFLRIKNFEKCLTKTQYCEFDGPAIVMRRGGSGWQKLPPKKWKMTKSIGFSLTFTTI